jgi:amino acid transporter
MGASHLPSEEGHVSFDRLYALLVKEGTVMQPVVATSATSALARKTVSASSLWFFLVSASAPMTVVAGAVVATYATTGVVGVPLSFLVLGVALALFSVGYIAMSRYVTNAGAFYAFIAQGLGSFWGVVAVPIALIGYNSIQVCLYGLLGATLSGLVGGSWWVWALVFWALVALVGLLNVRINAGVLIVVLLTEIAFIVLIDLVAFSHTAGGVSLAPLTPANLIVPGIGGVFAFGIASFIGYEAGPVFGEEARSYRAVARGTFGALGFLAVFYAISSWAMALSVGADSIVDTARDPESGLPFSILSTYTGSITAHIANSLLVTSVLAAMLSFHAAVSRYVFALSRDRLLPKPLAAVGRGARAGAPIGGSIFQSVIALVIILAAAIFGADPVATLFTWLASLAALGLMFLMAVTSLAVIRFFRLGGGTAESWWQRIGAPVLGFIAMTAVLVTTVANIGSVLGVEPGSPQVWILPGFLLFSIITGIIWAIVLRGSHPDVFRSVGRGQPKALEVVDQRLADLAV